MTPREVYALHDGYLRRVTAPGGMAWLGALIMNALGSPVPLTAHTILGLAPPTDTKTPTDG